MAGGGTMFCHKKIWFLGVNLFLIKFSQLGTSFFGKRAKSWIGKHIFRKFDGAFAKLGRKEDFVTFAIARFLAPAKKAEGDENGWKQRFLAQNLMLFSMQKTAARETAWERL